MGREVTKILELLYPRRCPLCGDIVVPKGETACLPCQAGQKPITGAYCFQCGKPLEVQEKEYCYDCKGNKFSFERCYSLWAYDSRIRRSVGEFKYKGKKEYADYYVKELLGRFQKELERLSLDAVVPVPIHCTRRRKRGYNQAELLAAGVAGAVGIEIVDDLLLRTGKTLPQKDLSGKERSANLKAAFQINPYSAGYHKNYRRILLVDDIYTTGSTAEACAKELKGMGVPEVYVMCLCVGKGL